MADFISGAEQAEDAVQALGGVAVLFVDAQPSVLTKLKERIELNKNLQVDTVSSVQEGYTLLENKKYDAIVFNFDRPQKSLDDLKEIRAKENRTPLILLAEKENIETGLLNLNINRFIAISNNLEEKSAELTNTIFNLVHEKRSIADLKTNEERLRVMIEAAKDAIILMDERGKISGWNRAAAQIFGYTADEVMGKTLELIVPPERLRAFAQSRERMFQKLHEQGNAGFSGRVAEMPGRRKDGSIVPTEMSMSVLNIGNKWQGLAIVRDITERKKIEGSLKNSEEQFRSLAENSPNMIFINQNGKLLYVNNEAAAVMGYTKEEFYSPNFNFLLLISPEYRDMVRSTFAKHVAGEEIGPYEVKLVTKNGLKKDAIINTRMITYNDEPAILGIATDITERKNDELEIMQAKERFMVYVEASPVAIFVADSEGRYEYVNEAASKLLGYSRDELLTMSIPQLIFEQDLPLALKNFVEVKETGKSLTDLALKTKSGLPVYVILNSVKLPDGNLLAFCENVTEQKNAEKEIQLQTERLKATFAASPDAIVSIDMQGNIVDCNEETLRLFVYPSKESLVGKSCLVLVAESERQRVMKDLSEIFQKNAVIRNEEFIATKSNGAQFVIDVSESILKDHSGNIAGVIATARDITERKKAEEQIRLLSSVVEQTVEGIAVSGHNGEVLFVNSAWLKMHSFTEDEKAGLIGQDVSRFYCTQFESMNYSMHPGGVFRGRTTQVRKDGTTFSALATLSPLRNPQGQIIGVIHMAKPLTEIVRDIRDVKSANSCKVKKDNVEIAGV
jgi:PAS domain S-box-containing protein